ncbi:MAG: hypothetical protein ABIK21_02535 [bacterium]
MSQADAGGFSEIYGDGICDWMSNKNRKEMIQFTIGVIKDNQILPEPGSIDQGKIKILSPSAHNSESEKIIQELLGEDYLVVGGDIASIQPKNDFENYYRGDAIALPFGSGEFSAIYDRAGAAWHLANKGKKFKDKIKLKRLFKEYARVLSANGVVIVDGGTYVEIVNILGTFFKFKEFERPKRYSNKKDNINSPLSTIYIFRKK